MQVNNIGSMLCEYRTAIEGSKVSAGIFDPLCTSLGLI